MVQNSSSKHNELIWRRFSPRETLFRYAWYIGIVFLVVWSLSNLDIEWIYFLDAHIQAKDMIVRMWPPDITYINQLLMPLIETIHIATIGTIITYFIAFPLAFLAARNTTINSTTWLIGRLILVGSRSINTIVWGLLFVAIFGPGPLAGIWAITFRSIGFMGKLIAEAIEEIDEGTTEAIEATGASRLQVLLYGVLPQVLPVIYGTLVYRWDINIRESTVLGFVGAGGLGLLFYKAINLFHSDRILTLIIVVFIMVNIVDSLSQHLRKRLL